MMAVYGAQPRMPCANVKRSLRRRMRRQPCWRNVWGNPAEMRGQFRGNHGNHGIKMVDFNGFDMISPWKVVKHCDWFNHKTWWKVVIYPLVVAFFVNFQRLTMSSGWSPNKHPGGKKTDTHAALMIRGMNQVFMVWWVRSHPITSIFKLFAGKNPNLIK